MEYNFSEIEKKWQKYWQDNKTFSASNDSLKPKFYVLDMFPYPSGAGLHVGHPLGYIASDIYSRYMRLNGYNVLHPMGYDSFGLPAEQYAIQTGQHPAITTENNIARYREQLDKIGFSFDWDREVRTSDPKYYKWTQWIFLQFFNAWYNRISDKAENIETLIAEFKKNGNMKILAVCDETEVFSAEQWEKYPENKQQEILLKYRLAYLSDTWVNWCPQLGTVLANEEVKDGVSERGGYPVERKLMKQWSMRITAYAERLLNGLDEIEWSDSIKEQQRNWIGKSVGATVRFHLSLGEEAGRGVIEVFTTRPDTVFGATFLTLAPEHELVKQITTDEYREAVESYAEKAKNRSERERMADVKTISGQFTGAYAIHPFSGEKIPVWIGDYVLAGYGTGAVMAVPAHDARDYAFSRHFNIPIKEVVEGGDIAVEAYEAKEGTVINSEFLNGLHVKDAIKKAIEKIEEKGIGQGRTNYRIRDAIFSRQRYWGEPFPIYYKDGAPCAMKEDGLPLELPEVDKYLPTETGEPPLARAEDWGYRGNLEYEKSTMPGWAGSSWYFYRYMDAENDKEFASKKAVDYWKSVDLYIGGSEHATGHLLYARFWNKFLFDLGYVSEQEPFKKLINQGMIQGRSNFIYRMEGSNTFVSAGKKSAYKTFGLHVDVNIVENDVLDIEAFKKWRPEYADADFILEDDGKYICGWEVEKMSKSKWNVVSPDDIVERYGADTLRLYEMFLGPLEQSKPWNTNGIEGVHRFLKKLWRLYFNEKGELDISEEEPGKPEMKTLHKTIKKVKEDIERFSFNTSVSTFMICVNELTDLKGNKKVVLDNLAVLLSSYAPHIAEELWQLSGNKNSVSYAQFPAYDEKYLIEDTFSYPVSFNGKTRFSIELPIDMSREQVEQEVLNAPEAQKWLAGSSPKKVIVVPKRIVNVVV
jgi:leucyl-tRNA synthetase